MQSLVRLAGTVGRLGVTALRPTLSAQGATAVRCLHISAPAATKHLNVQRTRSSVKKRFKLLKNGNIVRKKGGKSHLNRSKSSARLNFLSKTTALTGGIRARYLRVFQASALAGK